MTHPHPDKRYLTKVMRRFILHKKQKDGSARSQVHYLDYVQTYLEAKRELSSPDSLR